MSGLSLSLGLGLTSLRPSGGTPTPTPAPVITFDGTNFANTLGNPGQWQADGSDIAGQSGATMAYVEATMAGRAIQQSIAGVLSNAIVVEASALPATLINFNVADTKLSAYPATPFTMMGGGGTTQQDKYTVASNQLLISPLTLAGTPATKAIATRDTGSITHFAELEVTAASAGQCAALIVKVGSEISYLRCYFNGTDALGIDQFDNSASSTNQTTNGINITGSSAVGTKVRMETSADDKWRILVKRPADSDFLPYGKSPSNGAAAPQTDIWYSFSAGLHNNTKVGVQGEQYGATQKADNFRYGSLARPIILTVASQARSPDDPNKTRVTLGGTYGSGVTAIEFYVTLADGTLVQDWTAGQALSGGVINQYVDIPLTSGEPFLLFGRDPSNPATVFKVNATAPILPTVFPYRRGVNEGYIAEWTTAGRERNMFAGVPVRLIGSTWEYMSNFSDPATGLAADGQYHSYPTDAGTSLPYTKVGFSLPLSAQGKTLDLTYPATMTASFQSLTDVTILQAPSGGTVKIAVGANGGGLLQLAGAIPSAGVGPANVTAFLAGETDKTSYLSDEFIAGMAAWAAGGQRLLYRNMTADDINNSSRPITYVNHGGQGTGPLSPEAWAQISYINGTTDLWINISDIATDGYIDEFFAALALIVNPLSKIYVEFSNEVWNSGFIQFKRVMFEACKLGLHAVGASPSPLPNLIYSLDDSKIDPTTAALKVNLNAGDTILWNKYGTGFIIMRCASAHAVGDIVPTATSGDWTLVASNTDTGRAQKRRYADRAAAVFDKADAAFGPSKVAPVVAWQQGGPQTDILEWNNLYLKVVGRGRYAVAPYWGDTLGDWGTYTTGWGATEQGLINTDIPAFKTAFFSAALAAIQTKLDATVASKDALAVWCVSKGLPKDAIQSASYECNWHTIFGGGWPAAINTVYRELIRDARWGGVNGLMTKYATGLATRVGGDHVWFDRIGKIPTIPTDAKLQSWAITETEADITSSNARFTALMGVV